MASFGDVLRGLGSVLNPQAAQDLAREDIARQQANQSMMMFALQNQAAQRRMEQEQYFASSENAKKLTAQYQLHQADIKAKAAERMEQIREQAIQGRITKEEADARAAQLRKEVQDRDIAARQELAQLMAGLRQPPQPQLVTNENGVFQVDRSGRAVPVMGPDNKPLPGKPAVPEKAMPASAAKGLLENQQNLRRAEQALALIEGKKVGHMQGDKNATGIKGYLGEAILQRVDPSGIDARAAMADLGSLIIHDRSGAAVTAAEFPRLRPFIPQTTDEPATVQKKLKRFVQVYKEVVDDTRSFYKDSGYKVPESSVGSPGVVNFGDLK